MAVAAVVAEVTEVVVEAVLEELIAIQGEVPAAVKNEITTADNVKVTLGHHAEDDSEPRVFIL